MHRLKKCLRMKANVASFVADTAVGLGLDDWDLVPNPDAAGGRVIIYEGSLAAAPAIIAGLVEEAGQLGNYPVDLLACVPPQSIVRTSSGLGSAAAEAYLLNGGKVWDGTVRDVREHYPTDREELRFVQYDSCRGLEGWTTINYDLDQLWDYKAHQWLSEDHAHDPLMESREEAADRHAARWIMIPLTRAIDTLVINIGSVPGPLRSVLRSVANSRPDFVEWIDLRAGA